MTSKTKLPPEELQNHLAAFFCNNNTAEDTARAVARALVRAEIDGKFGHGLSRAAGYAAQAKSGKVDGMARAEMVWQKPAALHINARHGFAYPALDLAKNNLPEAAQKYGIAAAAVRNSHHCGVAGHHAEDIANAGCIAFLFGNTPKAMAPWGGKTPLFGTNPLAFAAPQKDAPPLVIDMSASAAARGKIVNAARDNKPIPAGWAMDKNGNPTTAPAAALAGSLLPAGGAKGSALALMVEVLAGALCGAAFSYEAESFFTAEGAPPSVGQALIAVHPESFAADFSGRLAELLGQIAGSGARIPGGLREERRRLAQTEGVEVAESWLVETAAGEV